MLLTVNQRSQESGKAQSGRSQKKTADLTSGLQRRPLQVLLPLVENK